MEWAIAATRGVPAYRTIVSSDSAEILAEAQRLEVETLPRPGYLAQDWTPDLPVAQQIVNLMGLAPDDLVVWLRPTAPFRRPDDVEDVIAFMTKNQGIDSLRSVIHAVHHPLKTYQVAGDIDGQPWLVPYVPWESRTNHPRQFLPPAWQAAGWIDAVRVRCISGGSMEGGVIAGWPVPFPEKYRGFQIDTQDDLEEAHLIAGARHWTPGKC